MAERDRLRGQGLLAGIGIAACLEPSGGNSSFEPLLNPKDGTTTWMESCRISVDLVGAITATMHTHLGRAGARDPGRHRGRRGAGDRSRPHPRGARRIRSTSLPSNSPVGSRMAIMLGGAAFHAAQKLKDKLVAIAAHDLGVPAERAIYGAGGVFDRAAPQSRLTWAELVTIAHRHIHRLPPGIEPGLAVQPHHAGADRRRQLPTADGRVQMYPCFSFEFHLMLVAIDPDLGKPEIKRYFIGHDCGTVINPKIVRGMTMGGIAHGIGAALYEEFAYNERRPADGAELHGLSAAVVARGAAGRDRASRDAVAAHRVRPEGLRRSPAISARLRRSQARSTTRCGRSGSR